MTYVYALIDPARPDQSYVGVTVNPKKRYSAHLRDIRDPENCSAKADFFRTTIERGEEVIMTIIDICANDHDAIRIENSLIRTIGTLNKKRSSYRMSYARG